MADANRGEKGNGNKSREVKCGECRNVMSEMDTGIMCEVCNMWHHAKCKGVSDEAYAVLQGKEAMHWYCKRCNKGMAKLLQTMSALQERQEKMQRSLNFVTKEVDDIKKKNLVEISREIEVVRKLQSENDTKLETAIEAKLMEQVQVNITSKIDDKLNMLKCMKDDMSETLEIERR